jgi:hypothetical protein
MSAHGCFGIAIMGWLLPKPQREFWENVAGTIPAHFVLHGGTAVALRFGHRHSVDFDFFSEQRLDVDRLLKAISPANEATVLDRKPDTVTVSVPMPAGNVKLYYFGGISFGSVGDPDRVSGKVALASALDLLGTKLKTIHDRIEAKDYLDIEALLRSGLTLGQGIAAAASLFGRALNPLDTAKAVAWFKDGDLETKLPGSTKAFLVEESAKFDPALAPLPIKIKSLSPG